MWAIGSASFLPAARGADFVGLARGGPASGPHSFRLTMGTAAPARLVCPTAPRRMRFADILSQPTAVHADAICERSRNCSATLSLSTTQIFYYRDRPAKRLLGSVTGRAHSPRLKSGVFIMTLFRGGPRLGSCALVVIFGPSVDLGTENGGEKPEALTKSMEAAKHAKTTRRRKTGKESRYWLAVIAFVPRAVRNSRQGRPATESIQARCPRLRTCGAFFQARHPPHRKSRRRRGIRARRRFGVGVERTPQRLALQKQESTKGRRTAARYRRNRNRRGWNNIRLAKSTAPSPRARGTWQPRSIITSKKTFARPAFQIPAIEVAAATIITRHHRAGPDSGGCWLPQASFIYSARGYSPPAPRCIWPL